MVRHPSEVRRQNRKLRCCARAAAQAGGLHALSQAFERVACRLSQARRWLRLQQGCEQPLCGPWMRRLTKARRFLCSRSLQERFARKNEAEDLRRAFDVLDTKKCALRGPSCSQEPGQRLSCFAPARRDGAIDADEVEQIFKQLGHKCKRVRACAESVRG